MYKDKLCIKVVELDGIYYFVVDLCGWRLVFRTTQSGVLTTKFGNLSIGDEGQIEEESKTETVAKTEQESAAVQIGYDQIG